MEYENTQNLTDRQRMFDIDRAKGFAILLVVFGHIVMRVQPENNEWYTYIRTAIYTFHMPFFMYLSGLVTFYTGAAFTPPTRYFDYLKKRGLRLLVPFLLMGLLIYFGKAFASLFIVVDHANSIDWSGLTTLVWNTHTSPATSLWFVFVLFVYCVFVPPMLWVSKGRILPLILFSAVLYIMPMPEYIYLDKIGHFFLFFMLGGLAAMILPRYTAFIDRWGNLFLIAFAASLILSLIDMNWVARLAIAGILSMPALHSLMRHKLFNRSDILLFLGKYSFVIYLFNTIAIGGTKGIMLHFVSWDGLNFLFFAPVLFAAGVALPILLKLFVFRHVKFLDRITA